MKMSMPMDTQTQWRDPGNLGRNLANMTVIALGPGMVGGQGGR